MHADERASASLLMQIKRGDERSPQVRRRSDDLEDATIPGTADRRRRRRLGRSSGE